MKKKQIVLSIGSILGGITLFQTSVDAASTSVQVKSGDTLWSIATKYQTSVQNLKTQNNLKSDVIHIGQTLVISSNASKPSEPTKPVETAKPTPSTPSTASTYKVQSGDTLYKIAAQFKMSVSDLKRLNSLSSNVIYVNQTLKVNGQATSSNPKPEVTEPQTPSVSTNGTYKVQQVDTLSKIAAQFKMSVSALKTANNLKSDIIYVNQVLKVTTSGAAPSTQSTGTPSTTTPNNGQLNISKMITDAKKYIGVPYKWGGTTPSGFDCSGFIYYVMKEQISMPRYTTMGFWNASKSISQPQPGDLVFFTTYTSGPSHLGIYLGNRQFIHAGSSTGVTISSLDNSYWNKRYLGAKRFSK